MALRVLLADESSTIKKVFQLALQDFAVEVKPVNVGVDVVPIAQSFKPDIIFADVLLQKRSGYEVAAEVKQDPQLRETPVVLMWSGFMELDDDKFQASHANAQLEKPFDVTALRKLVTDLVPNTRSQRLSQFLTFPKDPEVEVAPVAPIAPSTPPPPIPSSGEDFTQMPIPKMKGADKYRVEIKPEELEPHHVPVNYEVPADKMDANDGLDSESEQENFSFREPPKAAPHTPDPIDELPDLGSDALDEITFAPPPRRNAKESVKTSQAQSVAPQLSEAQLEKIIRAQSHEIIEAVVWKVIPDLAAQIIERELAKLLKERDSHPV